jgi:hypothetical protein
MENEGIMALPPGQPMQNQGPAKQPIYVSSADTYDAALTALGASTNDPAQAEAVRQAVRESIDELDLSPTEVDALLEVLEHMSQNPSEYPQIRQRLIDSGMMDDDDLPEAYDPAYLGMAIMALNEYKQTGVQGAQAPMEMSPVVEGLEPMAMAEGGLADMAKYLASQGRNGDTILAHITPAEARLLKSMGGSGTINPQTGLPEFFLKKLFKGIKKAVKKILKNPIFRVIATVALATVLGPAGLAIVTSKAAAGAIAGGAITAASGGKLKDVLVASATGYFGGGGTIGGVAPAGAIASKLGLSGALGTGVGAGVTGTGIGLLAGMKPEEALKMGALQGISAGATQAFQNLRVGQAPTAQAAPPDYGLEPIEVTAQRINPPGTPAVQAAPSPTAQGPVEAPVGGIDSLSAPAGTRYDVATGRFVPTAMPTTAAGTMQQIANLPGSSFTSRVGEFIRDPSLSSFKDAFLVNPNAAQGTLARYTPGIATALAVTGAAGGFKAGEADQEPLFKKDYTGMDYMRDNPELFKGQIQPTVLKPYNPVVETPSYGLGASAQPSGGIPQPSFATLPVSAAPNYVPPPGSMTNMPGGIPQPYNVQGLYGVPLLYGNPVQPAGRPPGYAGGGIVDKAIRSAVMDPRQVAKAEGMLYAGPQAGQQAAMAVQQLDRQGIMGVQRFNKGGQPTHFPRKNGPINGPGTGTSDSIPAMLSDGEFVFTAKAVRNAGNGSRRKGARRMYKLMKMLEGGNVKGK